MYSCYHNIYNIYCDNERLLGIAKLTILFLFICMHLYVSEKYNPLSEVIEANNELIYAYVISVI